MARPGTAWLGVARPGPVGHGGVRRGVARSGEVSCGGVWIGTAR